MNAQTHKSPVLVMLSLLAVLAIVTMACSFSGVRVYHPSPVTVDVVIHEAEFNNFGDHSSIHVTDECDHMLDRATHVDFDEGVIRFFGTKDMPDGSEAEGSLDLSMTAENGALHAEIVAVDIPGVSLSDACIVEANQAMEEAFTDLVTESNGEVLFQEVTVEEGLLRMKIQVNFD